MATELLPYRLWLWRNGDHFLAFDSLFPTMQNGDPATLGEPAGWAFLRRSKSDQRDYDSREITRAEEGIRRGWNRNTPDAWAKLVEAANWMVKIGETPENQTTEADRDRIGKMFATGWTWEFARSLSMFAEKQGAKYAARDGCDSEQSERVASAPLPSRPA